MKLQLNFKTPDAVYWAFKDNDVPPEDQPELERLLKRWISYGESVNLEVDIEKETIKVLQRT